MKAGRLLATGVMSVALTGCGDDPPPQRSPAQGCVEEWNRGAPASLRSRLDSLVTRDGFRRVRVVGSIRGTKLGPSRPTSSASAELLPDAREPELDDERILVLTRLRGRGKASNLELGQMQAKGADLLHIRDGKVRRFVLSFDRERALADLGLAVERGHPE